MANPVVDIALAYDPINRRCDVVFSGKDFALDATPASAVLMSTFADRRAHPDDPLTDAVPDWSNPSSLVARRGYPGDFLSQSGGFVGSRLWLLGRRKATEATRKDAEGYAIEAYAWLETVRNYAVQLTVRLVATLDTPAMGILVRVGRTQLSLQRALS
jgi:phage gp46-like protein